MKNSFILIKSLNSGFEKPRARAFFQILMAFVIVVGMLNTYEKTDSAKSVSSFFLKLGLDLGALWRIRLNCNFFPFSLLCNQGWHNISNCGRKIWSIFWHFFNFCNDYTVWYLATGLLYYKTSMCTCPIVQVHDLCLYTSAAMSPKSSIAIAIQALHQKWHFFLQDMHMTFHLHFTFLPSMTYVSHFPHMSRGG